jgi:four helix bundle protein
VKENLIKIKSFDFAVRIIKLSRFLKENHKEFDISRQIIRSGTAIGAMVREAENAESRADFIHNSQLPRKNQMKHFIGWNYYWHRN